MEPLSLLVDFSRCLLWGIEDWYGKLDSNATPYRKCPNLQLWRPHDSWADPLLVNT